MSACGRPSAGDTLLIGATGRTDLPTGDPEALYDSLFTGILRLDAALKVHPAHEYKGRGHSTIARELAENPRLQNRDRAAFVDMMRNLNLTMPTHITEALRSNMSGGKTVAQLLAEAAAAVPFMSRPSSRRASKPQSRISSCWTCANATPTRADTSQGAAAATRPA